MTVSIGFGERTTPEFLEHIKEAVNSEINPTLYLGIDPGKANGICGYDAKYYLTFMLTVHAEDMPMFLHQFKKIKKCIVEDYKLYPNKAKEQIYSNMETPRVIGRIESWAIHNEVELIKQGATIKTTAYAWLGQKPPSKSNKQNHQLDAHAHFIYWAVKNGKVNAADLLRRTTI